MLVDDIGALSATLAAGFVHPHWADSKVEAALTQLLRNKNVPGADEISALMVCMATTNVGQLHQSQPKEVIDKLKAAGLIVAQLVAEKMNLRVTHPVGADDVVPQAWADLVPLENALRHFAAKRINAEASGERGVYLCSLGTPAQMNRPEKGTVCPGLDVPVSTHALLGTEDGVHSYLEGVREVITKGGLRTAAGNLIATLVGPHWPCDVSLEPGSMMRGVEVINGGGGARGAILKFEAVGSPAQVVHFFKNRYVEMFPSSQREIEAGRMEVPIFLSVSGMPTPVADSFMDAVDLGTGRISDKMMAIVASVAHKTAANFRARF